MFLCVVIRKSRFSLAIEFEVRNLSVHYGDKDNKAIDDLSLVIDQGSFNLIVGHNGSGKSTLMRVLSGIQNYRLGTILWRGQDRAWDRQDFNRGIQIVSEDSQFPIFKTKHFPEIYKKIWPDFSNEIFQRVIRYLDLNLEKSFWAYSRGQKILFQFALSLATQPKVLIADEVTAALDPYIRRKVVEEMIKANEEQSTTILLASNIVSEVHSFNTRMIFLSKGRLIKEGLFSEIAKDYLRIGIPRKLVNLKNLPKFAIVASGVPDELGAVIHVENWPFFQKDCRKITEPVTPEDIFVYATERDSR